MTTLNLTPEQKEAVWNALEDRVDEIKKELYECRDRASSEGGRVEAREELEAAREILEIFEGTIGRSHLLHH